ncbi:MAG: RHS repeat-associated core domain-containing protein [Oscillospiraceae bacterium]
MKTEFFYNGSILAGQKCGNDTLIFMYDNNGDSFGFTYNGTEYYYVKNAQNDVTAITDNMGIVVAKYTYDAWGKVIDSEDLNLLPNSILISEINPIRYRSYYFDAETNLYHLNTRYYSPIMCRFLNADDTNVLDADQDSLVENNLFAYCLNNPVNHNDSDGKIARTLKRGLALGIFAVGFAVGWKVAAVATVVVGIAVVIGATVSYYKEHVSTKNGKKKNKHQKGKARRNRDQGGEKKKRNSGWKRPR